MIGVNTAMSAAHDSSAHPMFVAEAVPAISKVVDATDHATGENPYYS